MRIDEALERRSYCEICHVAIDVQIDRFSSPSNSLLVYGVILNRFLRNYMISDTKGIELMRQNEQLVNHSEFILCFQVL